MSGWALVSDASAHPWSVQHAPFSRSWCETVDSAVEESDLPHVAESRDTHEQSGQANTEPAVRRAAVPEEIEVVLQGSESIALLLSLLDQLLVAVLTLSTRRDLEPLPQKVESQRVYSGRE